MRQKRTGIRTCVACGKKRDKREMLRLVTDADGRLTADSKGVMTGRGAYVCRTSDCFGRLAKIRKSRWSRLFRREDVLIVLDEIQGKISG